MPFLKKVFLARGARAWLYDYDANTWTGLKVPNDPDIPWNHYQLIPQLGACDTGRKRVYTAAGKRFLYFDFARTRWVRVRAEGQPTFGNSNSAALHYDSAAGVFVCHLGPQRKGPRRFGEIHVYDPEANKWTRPAYTFPAKVHTARLGQHGFYDSRLNAHFYYLAGDSGTQHANMLVYRYKRAGDADKPKP